MFNDIDIWNYSRTQRFYMTKFVEVFIGSFFHNEQYCHIMGNLCQINYKKRMGKKEIIILLVINICCLVIPSFQQFMLLYLLTDRFV